MGCTKTGLPCRLGFCEEYVRQSTFERLRAKCFYRNGNTDKEDVEAFRDGIEACIKMGQRVRNSQSKVKKNE